MEVERLLHVHKLDAARAFARANRIDRVVLGGAEGDWLTLVTTGKSWQDVVAALDEATTENGCMHIIPGGHMEPIVHFKRRDWQICDEEVDTEGDDEK